jgi:hypothetical protein
MKCSPSPDSDFWIHRQYVVSFIVARGRDIAVVSQRQVVFSVRGRGRCFDYPPCRRRALTVSDPWCLVPTRTAGRRGRRCGGAANGVSRSCNCEPSLSLCGVVGKREARAGAAVRAGGGAAVKGE